MVRAESAFTGLYYLNETFDGTNCALRARRLSLLPVAFHASGNQDTDRPGAIALRAASAGERAREDWRRGAHQLRRAPVQLSLRQARAPSAHGRADHADPWRRRL